MYDNEPIIIGAVVVNNTQGFFNVPALYKETSSEFTVEVHFMIGGKTYQARLAKSSISKARQIILINEGVKCNRSLSGIKIGFGTYVPVYSKFRDTTIQIDRFDALMAIKFKPEAYGFG